MEKSIRLLFLDKVDEASKAVWALPPETILSLYEQCDWPFFLRFTTNFDYNGKEAFIIGEVTVFPKIPEDEEEKRYKLMPVSTNEYNPELPLNIRFVMQDVICGMAHLLAAHEYGQLDEEFENVINQQKTGKSKPNGIIRLYEKKATTVDAGEIIVSFMLVAGLVE
jgi:hypothetical protein